MRASYLIAVALFLFYGCSGEPPPKPDPATYYIRLHNQTGRVLRVDVENTYYSESPSSRHLLTADLVKTILGRINSTIWVEHDLVRIYDNGTDKLLVLKYLDGFNFNRDVDPSIREKEERFEPGQGEHVYYIFLKPEDIGGDAPGG